MSWLDITQSSSSTNYCMNIMGASQLVSDTSGNSLMTDINAGAVPQVAWYLPDQCNDCHDTYLDQCGPWLWNNFFGSTGYFSKANAVSGRTLVAVIFDENENGDYAPKGNQIYGVLIPYGTMKSIVPGEKCGAYYTHYSLLQLIEQNWGIGNLGRNDASTSTAWGGPMCADTLSNCNAQISANAKCSCNMVGNTCP